MTNNCAVCNLTHCTTCLVGYDLINGICLSNCRSVSNCISCIVYVTQNFTQCFNCSLGYILNGRFCQSICGDGIKTIDEQCDDNNTFN